MIHEKERDLEGGPNCLIDVLLRRLHGRTEENHEDLNKEMRYLG